MGAGLVLGDCNAWFVHTGMEYLRIFNIVQIWNNVHEYIGKRATFTYFERTKAGNYRHPQFKCIRDYE